LHPRLDEKESLLQLEAIVFAERALSRTFLVWGQQFLWSRLAIARIAWDLNSLLRRLGEVGLVDHDWLTLDLYEGALFRLEALQTMHAVKHTCKGVGHKTFTKS
jgi:hypothetical protein